MTNEYDSKNTPQKINNIIDIVDPYSIMSNITIHQLHPVDFVFKLGSIQGSLARLDYVTT